MLTTLVGLIAFASPDKSSLTPTSITVNFTHLSNLCTVSNPASLTKSMGLSADAPLSWFLHRHLPTFAPGAIRAVYRDSVILTTLSRQETSQPLIGTVQKHMPTLTRSATKSTSGPLTQIFQYVTIMPSRRF
jgi:hypothetical protein